MAQAAQLWQPAPRNERPADDALEDCGAPTTPTSSIRARLSPGHARGDAEEILAQPAGGAVIPGRSCARRAADRANAGKRDRHRAAQAERDSPCRARRPRAAAAPGVAAGGSACERCPLTPATQTVPGRRAGARPCSSASSRATRRISRAGRSSAPPAGSSTGRWPPRASSAHRLPHQCGQALQIQFARQAAHAPAPGPRAIEPCRWWLEQELALVRPAVIVALGTTAAEALLGHAVRMAVVRGRPLRYGGSGPDHHLPSSLRAAPARSLASGERKGAASGGSAVRKGVSRARSSAK